MILTFGIVQRGGELLNPRVRLVVGVVARIADACAPYHIHTLTEVFHRLAVLIMTEVTGLRTAVLRSMRAAGRVFPVRIDVSFSPHAQAGCPFANFACNLVARVPFHVGRTARTGRTLVADIHQPVVGLLGRDIVRLAVAFSGGHHHAGPARGVGRQAAVAALSQAVTATRLSGQLGQLLEPAGHAVVVSVQRRLRLLLRLSRLFTESAAGQRAELHADRQGRNRSAGVIHIVPVRRLRAHAASFKLMALLALTLHQVGVKLVRADVIHRHVVK